MNTPEQQSYMSHAAQREDALPFRAFERAHHRKLKALQELAAANAELERAIQGMQHVAGYVIRDTAPGDELGVVAPIPAERFDAEKAA